MENQNHNEENTYVNGLGFFQKSPEQLEKKQLILQYNLILFSMLILFFLSTVIERPIIKFLALIGFDVRINNVTKLVLMSHMSQQMLQVVSYVVCMSVTICIIYFFSGRSPNLKPQLAFPKMGMVLNTSFIMLGVMLVASLLTSMFNSTMEFGGLFVLYGQETFPKEFAPFLAFTIFSILVIPFFEEFLFRGVILSSLKKYGDIVAIVVSSILYALFAQRFDLMVYNFVIGLGLSYFAVKSGSFISTFIASILMKSVSFLYMMMSVQYRANFESDLAAIEILILMVSIGCFIRFIIVDKDAFKINNEDTALTNRTKVKLAFTNIGFWMLAILAVLKALGQLQVVG